MRDRRGGYPWLLVKAVTSRPRRHAGPREERRLPTAVPSVSDGRKYPKKMNGAEQRQTRSKIHPVFINDNLALFYGVKIQLVWPATLRHEAAVSTTEWDQK